MNRRVPLSALALCALAAPWMCLAQGSPPPLATQNCAQALASRLHMRLAGVHSEPNFSLPISTAGEVHDQMIVSAHESNGRQLGPMVCTYDRRGRVLSLRAPAPVDTVPSIDASAVG